MADTIRRLQAYEEAGADVLYAPGLRNLAEVRQVVGAVNRPVNVVTGWLDPAITAGQLAEAGAKRISVGGALSRLALATFVNAGRAMKEQGSFAWMPQMLGFAEMQRLLGAGASRMLRESSLGRAPLRGAHAHDHERHGVARSQRRLKTE